MLAVLGWGEACSGMMLFPSGSGARQRGHRIAGPLSRGQRSGDAAGRLATRERRLRALSKKPLSSLRLILGRSAVQVPQCPSPTGRSRAELPWQNCPYPVEFWAVTWVNRNVSSRPGVLPFTGRRWPIRG